MTFKNFPFRISFWDLDTSEYLDIEPCYFLGLLCCCCAL